MSAIAEDPGVRSMESWRAALGAFKSRGVPEDDPRIVACRRGIAFHRARRAIRKVGSDLTEPAVDRLVGELRELAVAR